MRVPASPPTTPDTHVTDNISMNIINIFNEAILHFSNQSNYSA